MYWLSITWSVDDMSLLACLKTTYCVLRSFTMAVFSTLVVKNPSWIFDKNANKHAQIWRENIAWLLHSPIRGYITNQITNTLVLTSIRYRSDAKQSEACLSGIDPRMLAVWMAISTMIERFWFQSWPIYTYSVYNDVNGTHFMQQPRGNSFF